MMINEFFNNEWEGEENLPYIPIPTKFYITLSNLTDAEYGHLVRWSQVYFTTGQELPLTDREALFANTFKMEIGYYVFKYLDKKRKAKKSGSLGGKAKSASRNQTNFDLVRDDTDHCEDFSVAANQPGISGDATNCCENSGNKKEKENKNKKEKENNTPYSPPLGDAETQFSPGFGQFWNAYPKKAGKQAAWRSWSKGKCEPLTEVILNAVEHQKTWDSWTKENGQYIPNPSTWLNQGRWEDEPPEVLRPAHNQPQPEDRWGKLTDENGNF